MPALLIALLAAGLGWKIIDPLDRRKKGEPAIASAQTIRQEADAIDALIKATNRTIQGNKAKFSTDFINRWGDFVAEWLKFRPSAMNVTATSLSTGSLWEKVQEYRGRATTWDENVRLRIASDVPGGAQLPGPAVSSPESEFPWTTALVVGGIVGVGYMFSQYAKVKGAKSEAAEEPAAPRFRNGHARHAMARGGLED